MTGQHKAMKEEEKTKTQKKTQKKNTKNQKKTHKNLKHLPQQAHLYAHVINFDLQNLNLNITTCGHELGLAEHEAKQHNLWP